MSKLCVLGSSGSIGQNVLKTVDTFSDKLEVHSLAVNSNVELLAEQIEKYNPKVVGVCDLEAADLISTKFPHLKVFRGMEGICEMVHLEGHDTVVSAISGTRGIRPTYEAVKAKKRVCVANKESLVSAGHLIIPLARQLKVDFIPIDSEHTAIYHCLLGEQRSKVTKVYLTASGGPFRTFTKDQLNSVTLEQALNHPTWNMGGKNTIDSSTLVNKGLELIEACYLYDMPIDSVEIIVHPQSIIHSMVAFEDGSIKAQLSSCDMRLPIQFALSYPDHWHQQIPTLDFFKLQSLNFEKPKHDLFKGIYLAKKAYQQGPSALACMNAANEVLVNRFLKGEIEWKQITGILEEILDNHEATEADTIAAIMEIDANAREIAASFHAVSKKVPVS